MCETNHRTASDENLFLLEIGPRTAEMVSRGQMQIFPPDAIEDLALEIFRSTECHIFTTECEAAVVEFVRALDKVGWKFYRPCVSPQNSTT